MPTFNNQTGAFTFSPEDQQKIVDYISLLISIDQKITAKKAQSTREYSK